MRRSSSLAPPAIPELGIADGFDMYLEDRGGQGHQKLMQVRNQFLGMANCQDPRLRLVRPNGMEDTPQYKLDMDREKLSICRTVLRWGCGELGAEHCLGRFLREPLH